MKSLDQLKAILKEMVSVYDHLLAVGKEKQEALISGDNERLLSVFPKESALIKEISSLEERRQEETLSYQSLSLTKIIGDRSILKEKEELISYQSQLKLKLNELETLHATNKQLIHSALLYTNRMLELFAQRQEQPLTYSSKNNLNRKETNYSRRYFDLKA